MSLMHLEGVNGAHDTLHKKTVIASSRRERGNLSLFIPIVPSRDGHVAMRLAMTTDGEWRAIFHVPVLMSPVETDLLCSRVGVSGNKSTLALTDFTDWTTRTQNAPPRWL